jgi:hypothetical protein
VQVKQQMEDLDLNGGDPIRVVMGWDLNWYLRFVKMIQKHQPALVIIDSITGCSRGSAFDENRKEFAGPIYWLANNNGRLFPACTILLIHHSNKSGGFRGTTAIRDAVDEVWSLRKPTDKQVEVVGPATRFITVDKSRAGRGGSKLLLTMEDDLTFSLRDYIEVGVETASPASVVDRVLQRLRVASPDGRLRSELNADPLCGSKVAAIKKALQRLEARGLIFAELEPAPTKPGSFAKRYFALLSRDMCGNKCPSTDKPSVGLENEGGHGVVVSPLLVDTAAEISEPVSDSVVELPKLGGHQKACPPTLPSIGNGFGKGDNFSVTPQETERSKAEIDTLIEDARSFWS